MGGSSRGATADRGEQRGEPVNTRSHSGERGAGRAHPCGGAEQRHFFVGEEGPSHLVWRGILSFTFVQCGAPQICSPRSPLSPLPDYGE